MSRTVNGRTGPARLHTAHGPRRQLSDFGLLHMASSRFTDRPQGRLVRAHPLCLRQRSEETLILWSQSQSHGHVPEVVSLGHAAEMSGAAGSSPCPCAPTGEQLEEGTSHRRVAKSARRNPRRVSPASQPAQGLPSASGSAEASGSTAIGVARSGCRPSNRVVTANVAHPRHPAADPGLERQGPAL